MTLNPEVPTTKVEEATRTVRRFTYRHGKAIELVVFILIGFLLGKL